MRAFVGYDSKYDAVVSSIRGSADLGNWIDNIDIEMVCPYSWDRDVCVHAGFHQEYTSLKEFIVSSIEKTAELYNTNNLVVTGHSSGGANSILLAYDQVTKNTGNSKVDSLNLLTLMTFGAPRMGNENFAEAMEDEEVPHTRVVHWHDIAPHVPQKLVGYRHTATEVWYSEDSTSYTVCDGSGEDTMCSDSCAPFSCNSSLDHMTYIGIPIGSRACKERHWEEVAEN